MGCDENDPYLWKIRPDFFCNFHSGNAGHLDIQQQKIKKPVVFHNVTKQIMTVCIR